MLLAAAPSAAVFGARAAIMQPVADGELQVMRVWPINLQVDAKDLSVARWALEHAQLAGHGTDTLPGAACVCAPLRAAGPVGVLALWPAQRQSLDTEQRAFVDLFGRQVAAALERMQQQNQRMRLPSNVSSQEMPRRSSSAL